MKKKTIFFSIFVLIGIVIGLGVFSYFNQEDKMEGNYFRKMYGSIGMVNEQEYSITIDLFCFNDDVDFLNDIGKLTFDNNNISIKHVSYEEKNREKDLVVYSVCFSISAENNGRYDITTLHYQNDDKTISYPLGKLSFVCEYGNSIFLYHGCNTMIRDGKAVFTFSSKNEEAFTVVDLKLAEENGINYNYEKNVSYVPGNEISYELNVDYSVNEGDLFVVQPIFEIKVDGKKEVQFFTTNILVHSGDGLTYKQIKEYVK